MTRIWSTTSRSRCPRGWVLAFALAFAACGSDTPEAPVGSGPTAPTANKSREVVDTKLAFDVTAMTATATITLGPSSAPGASLEIGDLMIDSVQVAGNALPFAATGADLDLGLPASGRPIAVDFAYHWKTHEGFTGASSHGYTFIWPYYCGNLFPCHSDPADGTTFSLAITGVPADQTAVFPPTIPAEAPSYEIAWSIDAYTQLDLGTTTAGTQVSVWYRTNELTKAQRGTAHLVAAFDWLEQTLGLYRFGNQVGSVSVAWPLGAYGGMEHHPRWHIASAVLDSESANVHESAHGWFGDGIRIGCWEDFVLSEGTVSYLTARALEVVAPLIGAQVWQAYETQLAAIPGTDPVWPQSCGNVDVIKDNLYTNAPYLRGAFFYKGVADEVGATVLDEALAKFYRDHAGGAAHMSEMLTAIKDSHRLRSDDVRADLAARRDDAVARSVSVVRW